MKPHVAFTVGYQRSDPDVFVADLQAAGVAIVVDTPWGSETQIRSRRDAVALVDEPTEQVPPANIARADRDRDGDRGFSQRRGEAEGAMAAPAVVVLDIGPKRSIEMSPTSG
jgi:hypothetical protein